MTTAFCTSCGTPLAGARFCTRCGAQATVVQTAQPSVTPPPYRPAPVPGPVPVPTLPASGPARRSPWLWIAIAAVLVLVAGGGTAAYLLLNKDPAPAAPVAMPSVGTTPTNDAPTADDTPTSAAPVVLDQQAAGGRLVALLEEEARLHKPWDTDLGNVRLMCGALKPGEARTPYDATMVSNWLAAVSSFPAQRTSLASRAREVGTETDGTMLTLANRLGEMWDALGTVDAQFNARAQRMADSCPSDEAAPVSTGPASFASRQAWLRDFESAYGPTPIVIQLVKGQGSGL